MTVISWRTSLRTWSNSIGFIRWFASRSWQLQPVSREERGIPARAIQASGSAGDLVHGEIEWLRRGAKARTRKSKARISKAGELMGELADLNQRTRSTATQIDFSSTDRKTKRLIELQDVTCNMGDRALFEGLNFILTAGMRVVWWAERQRQDHSASFATGRPCSDWRRDSPR